MELSGWQGTALSLFLALGGAAMLWKMIKKNLPRLVDKGMDALLRIPAARKFVAANAKDLKEVIDECVAEIEKDIDEAAKEESPVPPPPPQP